MNETKELKSSREKTVEKELPKKIQHLHRGHTQEEKFKFLKKQIFKVTI